MYLYKKDPHENFYSSEAMHKHNGVLYLKMQAIVPKTPINLNILFFINLNNYIKFMALNDSSITTF